MKIKLPWNDPAIQFAWSYSRSIRKQPKKTVDNFWHNIKVCKKTYALLSKDAIFYSSGVCPHCGELTESYLHNHVITIPVKSVTIQQPRKNIFTKGARQSYWLVNDIEYAKGLISNGYDVKLAIDEK